MGESKRTEAVKVFAPISIGNVSVGFDVLGLALSPIQNLLDNSNQKETQHLGDVVSVRPSEIDQLECKGSFVSSLPVKKEENIVWQCLLEFNRQYLALGGTTQPLHVTLEKNTPVCSGLGSSACSVVAGLAAVNEFYGNPINQSQMLAMMGDLEAKISGSLHYDNVAPCYLGGLQLMLEDQDRISQSLPTFEECYWVIAYPDIEVSTRLAREILPEQYDRKDLITFGQRLAGFVDASYRQDKQQAFSLLNDVVAEPYRTTLLKNYRSTKEKLLEIGNLAVGISGSGPTVFAVSDDLETAQKSKTILEQQYLQSDIGFSVICKVDSQGTRRIEL
ncbi:MAG: homoserine kinase [Kangiellaceae bacterium]|nr:homoserine kinase [Kangiellaceae bacterium]